MESLDTGKDKIKRICEILKNETITPAKEEAQKILSVAEQEAHNIIRDAEKKAEQILQTAKAKLQKERELFESSLSAACRQGVEALKQDIEQKLFNTTLSEWLAKQTADPKIAAQLIEALVSALQKEGISADFSALIPKKVSKDSVNALLIGEVLNKLKEHSVVVGEFIGGVQLKLHDQNLTLDLTDEALKELVGNYIRKDFRALLFQS